MSKLHKVEVRNTKPGNPMIGRTCEILIDGKPLKGVTSFEFSVEANGKATVRLEMIADVGIETDVEPEIFILDDK